jgi:hypothetical protein
MIDLDLINSLTGGLSRTFDIACPVCGPSRRSPVNRKRKTLRGSAPLVAALSSIGTAEDAQYA